MKAKQENRLGKQLQQLGYARVLILDEIGYMPMTHEEASVLNRRYEKASIILTSNKGLVDWREMFGNNVQATCRDDEIADNSLGVDIGVRLTFFTGGPRTSFNFFQERVLFPRHRFAAAQAFRQ